MTRRCACGNITRVKDFDEHAVCEDCREETARAVTANVDSARAVSSQIGAQFVGSARGTRDDIGAR